MTAHKCFVFTFADVEVREREFCVVRAGEVLPVEPKAFRVLLFLLRNPHRLIKKDELLDAVWRWGGLNSAVNCEPIERCAVSSEVNTTGEAGEQTLLAIQGSGV